MVDELLAKLDAHTHDENQRFDRLDVRLSRLEQALEETRSLSHDGLVSSRVAEQVLTEIRAQLGEQDERYRRHSYNITELQRDFAERVGAVHAATTVGRIVAWLILVGGALYGLLSWAQRFVR